MLPGGRLRARQPRISQELSQGYRQSNAFTVAKGVQVAVQVLPRINLPNVRASVNFREYKTPMPILQSFPGVSASGSVSCPHCYTTCIAS